MRLPKHKPLQLEGSPISETSKCGPEILLDLLTYFNNSFTRSIINTASLVSFLGTASNLTYPGLYNNTLHEILQKPEVGTAVVNASTFEVSCGVINNLINPAPFSVTGEYL